ncbi:hypothetical protein Tco_0348486 [Tanacetum coccineum]
MQEVVLFYKALNVPTRQILDSKGAIPSMKATDAKKAIQEMAYHSQKWHDGTSTRNQRASIKALEIQIRQLSKILHERGSGGLPSSTEANPRDHVKCISTSVQTDQKAIRRIRFTPYIVSNEHDRMMNVYKQTTILIPSHLYVDDYDQKELNDVGGFEAYFA